MTKQTPDGRGRLVSGKLKSVIAKKFKFDEIDEAYRYMESNEQIGKIVVLTL